MATQPFTALKSPNNSSPSCSDSDDKCPVAQETQEFLDSGILASMEKSVPVAEEPLHGVNSSISSSGTSAYPKSTTPDSSDSSEEGQVKAKTPRAEGVAERGSDASKKKGK